MITTDEVRNRDDRRPLIFAYGAGTDSTAALVGLKRRGIRPDLIMFANTGAEKRRTYRYLGLGMTVTDAAKGKKTFHDLGIDASPIRRWLRAVGFPDITFVQYVPTRAVYSNLEEELLYLGVLPSISYGGHTCSIKYKIVPQDKYCSKWQPALECWDADLKPIKVIGYDAGDADGKRCVKNAQYASEDGSKYDMWYPLREWGWDRLRCKAEIAQALLPQPGKSACKFCGAAKAAELEEYEAEDLIDAIRVEDNGMASGKVTSLVGLSRGRNWRDHLEAKRILVKGKLRLRLRVVQAA